MRRNATTVNLDCVGCTSRPRRLEPGAGAQPRPLGLCPVHQTIVAEGERPAYCCALLSGYAYRQKIAGNGGRQILSVHMQGDMVDLHNALLGLADHSVQALTKVEAAFIPVEAVRSVALSMPAAGMAMWYETLVDGSIFREWTLNVGRRDARTRVAHLLCEFGVRLEAAGLGTQAQYELPMTQEQIADATGLTSVHVNRTLMGLARDGLIQRTQRAITIGNWRDLAHAGDFEPAYLHLKTPHTGIAFHSSS